MKNNYKVLFFYKDETEKCIDCTIILPAKGKDDAETIVKKLISVKIGISCIEEC